MKTIHRYELTEAINVISVPENAKVLSVGTSKNPQTKKEVISIWMAVEDTNRKHQRKFLVFGTGANLDDTINFQLDFIGTIKRADEYAFHVFETEI